jgi:uncharacterized protein YkvS
MSDDDDEKTPPRVRIKRFHTGTRGEDLSKRRTPVGGNPIPVEIDPEITPAPASPPEPNDIASLPHGEAVRRLAEFAAQNARAIAHEQQIRREGEDIGDLRAKVNGLLGLQHEVNRNTTIIEQTVMPSLRDIQADMKILLGTREQGIAHKEDQDRQWERLHRSIGGMNERISNLEKVDIKMLADTGVSDERIDSVTTRVGNVEGRVTSLEITGKVSTALTKRDKNRVGQIAGGVAAIIAGIAALIQQLTK